MKPYITYGLKSTKKDEKVIVKRVNDYLATHDRTMTKSKNKSMLDARLSYVFKHFYWNLNKEFGTWFEIFPNEDLEGKFYNQNNPNCGWLIKTRIDLTHPNYEKEKTEKFITEVLDSTELEYIILEEKEKEDD